MFCAVQFSKNHFTNLVYQSRGTGDAFICECYDGGLCGHLIDNDRILIQSMTYIKLLEILPDWCHSRQ